MRRWYLAIDRETYSPGARETKDLRRIVPPTIRIRCREQHLAMPHDVRVRMRLVCVRICVSTCECVRVVFFSFRRHKGLNIHYRKIQGDRENPILLSNKREFDSRSLVPDGGFEHLLVEKSAHLIVWVVIYGAIHTIKEGCDSTMIYNMRLSYLVCGRHGRRDHVRR